MINRMRSTKKGFTLVELLVVLVIIGILAAVAAPLFLSNARRARASEAVATMGLIRQALRDYGVSNNSVYYDIAPNGTTGSIQLGEPPLSNITLSTGALSAAAGVGVNTGVSQYFSNGSYTVDAAGTDGLSDTNGDSNLFANPAAVDFIIRVNGGTTATSTLGANNPCASGDTDNCSTNGAAVSTYRMEMDNSGRIFVCYDTCGTASNWSAY